MNIEDQATIFDDFGYSAYIEGANDAPRAYNCALARVIAEHKQMYKVVTLNGECQARTTGRQAFRAINRECFPAVGDWVLIDGQDGEKVIINEILPRRTILKKRVAGTRDKHGGRQVAQVVATNIDVVFIIESTDKDFNLNRFERYLVQIREGGIKPAIILNKTDLISAEALDQKVRLIKERFKGIDVLPTSTVTEAGLTELTDYIKKGRTYCFVGSSGVGKSSLLNKLLDESRIDIGEVSKVTGRGKHTTTAREMYRLVGGGLVIDNPGSREVGLTDSINGVEDVFDEIEDLSRKCRYNNCAHIHEPGCAVLAAVKDKLLDVDRYDNYLRLKKETNYYKMSELEKREKDRQFGKFIKKAKDQIRKTK